MSRSQSRDWARLNRQNCKKVYEFDILQSLSTHDITTQDTLNNAANQQPCSSSREQRQHNRSWSWRHALARHGCAVGETHGRDAEEIADPKVGAPEPHLLRWPYRDDGLPRARAITHTHHTGCLICVLWWVTSPPLIDLRAIEEGPSVPGYSAATGQGPNCPEVRLNWQGEQGRTIPHQRFPG